jgi:lysophospholipase L1-like esterase
MSAAMASAQGRAALAAGARVVPLGSLLGREFDDRPDWYFSADRFHPSAEGYAAAAAAILPSVLLAVDQPHLLARITDSADSDGSLELGPSRHD